MELDPIVLLAYISVAVNVITIAAATVMYFVFWLRRRRQKVRKNIKAPVIEHEEAVFLKLYVPPGRRLAQGVDAAPQLTA